MSDNNSPLFCITELYTSPLNQLTVLESLVDSLEGVDETTKVKILRSVQIREMSSSTYMNYGLAMPHARMENIERLSIAITYLDEPVDWPDEKRQARMVILLAIPHSYVEAYLIFMKKFIAWFKSIPDDKKEELLSNQDFLEAEVQKIIESE